MKFKRKNFIKYTHKLHKTYQSGAPARLSIFEISAKRFKSNGEAKHFFREKVISITKVQRLEQNIYR